MNDYKLTLVQGQLIDPEFLYKCLLALYAAQTTDEQQTASTEHDNGKGFTKADGTVMSVYAEAVKGGYRLSKDDLEDCYKRMFKYVKQLTTLLTDEQIGL